MVGTTALTPSFNATFMSLFIITGSVSSLQSLDCLPSPAINAIVCAAALPSPVLADSLHTPLSLLMAYLFIPEVGLPCGVSVNLHTPSYNYNYGCSAFPGATTVASLCCSPSPPLAASPPPLPPSPSPMPPSPPPPSPMTPSPSPPPPAVPGSVSPPPPPSPSPSPSPQPPSLPEALRAAPPPPPPTSGAIPLTYNVSVSISSGFTMATVQAQLCPVLRSAVVGVFLKAKVPFVEAGNTLGGCSLLYVDSGVIYYGASFLTNNAGNSATLNSMKASQTLRSSFGSAAHLPCNSVTTLINTNTLIQRAQLTPTNTPYLTSPNGCSSSASNGK